MTEWTRVKDKETGHEFSWPTESVDPDVVDVLDKKPATDRFGQPLPAKPNRPLASLTNTEGVAIVEMTVNELKDYALTQQIDLGEVSKKDDILAVVTAHEQGTTAD